MSDFNTSKVDGNTVGSAEWNQLSDVDNLTTTSGQTPSTTDLFQLSIASARYSSGGQFFTDSGTANTYVLSPVSPFKSPVDATNTYFNGMTIKFRAGNANSGASTVNINGAGSKNLKKEDGSTDLTAGDILTTKDSTFRYNGTSFVLVQDIRPATTTNQGVSYLNNPITIANNASDANNDIDFSAGNFNFSDGSGQAEATAVMTKRLDATWSAGSGNGGLFNGAAVPKAINSTYHCYKIYNPTTGAEDSGFLLGISGTAPDPTSALPSGYTKFERRGSILTDASGNIRAFTQTNNRFEYNSNITDLNAVLATSETAIGISAPWGLRTRSCMALNVIGSGAGSGFAKVYSHNISTSTISSSNATLYVSVNVVAGAGYVEATTNLSSQIKINAVATTGSPTFTGTVNTSAFIDLTLRF
jgi:hypothetical protein